MKQYYAIKARYPGAMLLFRVGDFYETFGEDAVKASKILNITLTKRGNGTASEIALAGFPHHSLDNYLPKLVKAGQRVAICDQLEDPKSVKGIVKRGVTELVTPGISFNDNVLDLKRNNYLASICNLKDQIGLAFLDISTGEFMISEGDIKYADKLLQSFNPSEIIYPRSQRQWFEDTFGNEYTTYFLEDWIFEYDFTFDKLINHFKIQNLKGFGVEELKLGTIAAGSIIHYLHETEHKDVAHIANISRIEEEHFVWLGKFTVRNLELFFPQHESGVPLIQILDDTKTPMGSRLLKKWMILPLKDVNAIEDRLSVVDALVKNQDLSIELQENLKNIW